MTVKPSKAIRPWHISGSYLEACNCELSVLVAATGKGTVGAPRPVSASLCCRGRSTTDLPERSISRTNK